jgi:hypothetical protein
MLFKRVVCALIVLATAGSVGAQSYGDWRLDITDGTVVSVMTTTDSNRVFGQVCDLDEAECVWILELSPPLRGRPHLSHPCKWRRSGHSS